MKNSEVAALGRQLETAKIREIEIACLHAKVAVLEALSESCRVKIEAYRSQIKTLMVVRNQLDLPVDA